MVKRCREISRQQFKPLTWRLQILGPRSARNAQSMSTGMISIGPKFSYADAKTLH